MRGRDRETEKRMRRVLEGMIKIQQQKETPLQEQSGLIISSAAFKPCPSEQSDRRLPGEVKAERRGERRGPMT